MITQSYITIINALNQFADNHLGVQRFKTSFFEQIDNFSSSDNVWPILYAVPSDVTFDEHVGRFFFRVYCVDALQKDRSNESAILNDTLLTLRDLFNWLKIADNGLNVLSNARAIPVNNFLVDYTAGWYLDIEIEGLAESNDCSIPFSQNFILTGYTCDYTYANQFLTCDTLAACQTIIDINDRIDGIIVSADTFTVGGSYDNSTGTLSLIRNDGGIIPVTGFTTGFTAGVDVFVTGGTYDSGSAEFTNNTGGTFSVSGFLNPQSLQDVTDVGNTTTNDLIVQGTNDFIGQVSSQTISAYNSVTGAYAEMFVNISGQLTLSDGTSAGILSVNNLSNANVQLEFPNKVTGTYTIATTADIPSTIVTDVTGTAPIASSGGATPDISISQADATTDGYLSQTDWNIFDGKFDVPTGTSADYLDGTGTPTIFPTIPTTPSLQDVTDVGNTTTNNIELIDAAEVRFGKDGGILLNNGARLREGTTDGLLGGSRGIAQICSNAFELKWEAGRLYAMEQDGFTIREVRYTFASTPTSTDDITKGYVVNSRWVLDNGDVYVCTDNTVDNAVWVLQSICDSLTNCDIITGLTENVSVLQSQIQTAVSGGSYTNGILTLNTIGDTSFNINGFQNTDIFVTGGTYNNGNAIFTNNTGGTFTVSGFAIGGGGGQTFYLNLSQSKNGNRYLSLTASTAAEQSTGVTIGSNSTATIASFESDQLNRILIPGGVWTFHLHSYKSNGNASFNIFVEVYKKTSGGTSTLLFQTDPEPVLTNSPTASMQITDSYFTGSPITVTDSLVAVVRATNTSNQSHVITLFSEGSQNYSYAISTFPTQQGLTCDTLSGCSIIQTIQSDISNKLDKSGGTITGGLVVNTTLSAATYLGLPLDIRVTGGTYNAGTATFTNNTGGTFSVSGFTLPSSFTGGTVTGPTNFTNGLTANTFSATTYLGLPVDIRVTGGTYSSGTTTLTLVNNTGGTFNVTGFTSGGGSNSIGQLTGDVTAGPATASSQSVSATVKQNIKAGAFGITIDGLGGVISSGQKGYVYVPYDGVITGWAIASDLSGSCVVDVWKDTFGNFPPTSGDSITGNQKPTLNGQIVNRNLSLTGWTTTISTGDIIGFNVEASPTGVTRVNLTINVTKS